MEKIFNVMEKIIANADKINYIRGPIAVENSGNHEHLYNFIFNHKYKFLLICGDEDSPSPYYYLYFFDDTETPIMNLKEFEDFLDSEGVDWQGFLSLHYPDHKELFRSLWKLIVSRPDINKSLDSLLGEL